MGYYIVQFDCNKYQKDSCKVMGLFLLWKWLYLLLLIVSVMQYGVVDLVSKACTKSTYQKLGSKSAYRLLKNKPRYPITFPGCDPIQAYLIARHGSRYPSSKMIVKLSGVLPELRDAIVYNADAGKSNLCKQDIALLKNWTLDMKSSSGHMLIQEGASELQSIGKILRLQFPSLWKEVYSSLDNWFYSTIESRAIESATNFSQGLFQNAQHIEKYIIKNNTLLRLYKKCGKWIEEVKKVSKKEKQNFLQKTHEVAKLIDSVTKRLGFNESLTLDEIQLMYTICQFHTAMMAPTESSTSVWCHLFSNQELQILEYADDLSTYWKDGYGYSLTRYLACPVIEDILLRFRTATLSNYGNNKVISVPIGSFHFTHSGMMLKLFTALGLFKDYVPPRATNYKSQNKRKWRNSYIDPFASNLQLVLFNCSSGTGNDQKFNVAAFVQQQEVLLPNCTSILCPLEKFFENYEHYVDACDLQKLCESNGPIVNQNNGKQDYHFEIMIAVSFIAICISIMCLVTKN